jgi:hypothetical protein
MSQPWEQLPHESKEWYDYFLIYLTLGPARTVPKAQRMAAILNFNGSKAARFHFHTWYRRASRYHWHTRACAFDTQVQRDYIRWQLKERAKHGHQHATYAGQGLLFEPSKEALKPFYQLLAEIYPDPSSGRRIAQQANLDMSLIAWDEHPINFWHDVVTVAAFTGKMQTLVNIILHEYKLEGLEFEGFEREDDSYSANLRFAAYKGQL